MKKKTVLLFFLIALFMPVLSGQNGLFSLGVPSLFAEDDFHAVLCHFTPGSSEALTLDVGTPALLNAHLAHGDTTGECYFCSPGVSFCIDPDGDPGIPSTSQPESPDSQRAIFGQ